MKTENERRFLVQYLPDDLWKHPHVFICQGYLSITEDGTEHRIRKEGNDFFSVVKKGSGQKRLESAEEMTAKSFSNLWPLTMGKRIWKTRYRIPYGEVVIELDIYWRQLQGLITAEVEFTSDEQALVFTPPHWFGLEVTDDRRYNDQHLAVYGKPAQIRFFPLSEGVPVLTLGAGVKKLVEVIGFDRDRRSGGSTVVLVGGGSSTGKTEKVAREAARSLGVRNITSVIISADDYNKGKKWKDAEAARGDQLTWDDPDIYDYRELFRVDLPKLLAGAPVRKRFFDFNTCEPGEKGLIGPADVIFIEGLHVLSEPWTDCGHIKVFVETSMHGRMIRRLVRDVERTGREQHQILKDFLAVVEPKHRGHIDPTRKNADFVIANEYNPETESGRTGVYKRQMKFKTELTDTLLSAAGAMRMRDMRYERDYYFSPHNRDIAKTGETIRIRDSVDGRRLTYQGPKKAAAGVAEAPILPVDLGAETEKAFRALYGNETEMIIKFRTLYRLDGIDISLDSYVLRIVNERMKRLGHFLEISLPDKAEDDAAVKTVLEKLGLSRADSISRSYLEM